MVFKFNIGDEIIAKTNVGTIEEPVYDLIKIQIIGFGNGSNDTDLLCYVPQYQHTPRSFKLTRLHQRYYNFNDKFLNERATFVKEHEITKHIPAPSGALCIKCQNFVMWAEQNETFLCRSCKENPYR